MPDDLPPTINVFAGGRLDRLATLRRDAVWVSHERAAPGTRHLPLWRLNAPVVSDSPAAAPLLAWLSPEEISGLARDTLHGAVLLGRSEGTTRFAVDLSRLAATDETPPLAERIRFEPVRAVAPRLAPDEAAILAHARSLVDWHARHRFCPACGGPSEPGDGGYVRRCLNPACGAQHFPRTDPVVIMVVADGDSCLVGRKPSFPRGLYTTLAGFVEPGESIEEAVRREVFEETGIQVGKVRYHSSQPWPFPSALMIGCLAEATSRTIELDPEELEDARWVDRETIRAAIEQGARCAVDPMVDGSHGAGADPQDLIVPAPMAIAHQLLRAWTRGDLAPGVTA